MAARQRGRAFTGLIEEITPEVPITKQRLAIISSAAGGEPGKIARRRGPPVLLVRRTLRHLRSLLRWGLADLEAVAGLASGNGRALVKALKSVGLIVTVGRGTWMLTQAGQTLSCAKAAKRFTRATAEKAL